MTQLDLQTPEQHRQRYEELKAKARLSGAVAVAPTRRAPLDPAALQRQETIPGGWYWTLRMRRGEILRITARGAVSALFWNADDTSERFNAGDTVKLQWTTRLGKGRVLLSDMGRVLVSIVEDTAGGSHDAIAGGSTPESDRRHHGDGARRNTAQNFRYAAGKLGLRKPDIAPCITFFANIEVDADGRLRHTPADGTEHFVELRAEMNLLVALSNCRHACDPDPSEPPPAQAALLRAVPIAADDLCRNFSDEAVRGFENTDILFPAV